MDVLAGIKKNLGITDFNKKVRYLPAYNRDLGNKFMNILSNAK